MPPTPLDSPFRIGPAVLDPAARRLSIDGRPVRLGGRAFDLLLLLIERRDRVVLKEEIFATVWPKKVVEENNLQVHVATLRRALGPDSIVTVSRRGYRFALALRPLQDGEPRANEPRANGPSASRPSPTLAGNLPAEPGPLVGRDADLKALDNALSTHPLLTIVGPGGIGKSRLAVASARRSPATLLGEGAWLVELASVQQPHALYPAVARVFGLGGKSGTSALALCEALSRRNLLIVLDNCEHLLDAVAELVGMLLTRAPGVRVIATSQAALGVVGEYCHSLGALALPSSDRLNAARGSGAIQLFCGRAATAMPGFTLDEDSVAAVVDICRGLDGIPLALEMAAARVPLLGVAGIRERLDDRLEMLARGRDDAEPRHRTLRATLEWSLGLLSEAERRLFRRLGVFVGGFTLAAAQAVAQEEGGGVAAGRVDEWAMLDGIGRLVERLLVVSDGASSPRLSLLETMRAMALEEAARADESQQLARRHAAWLRALFDRADADHVEMSNERWLARFGPELGNLRAAIHWAVGPGGDTETAVALAATSVSCWFTVGSEAEALRYIELTRPFVDSSLPAQLEARWWSGITTLALRRTMAAGAGLEACDRALVLFASVDDKRQQYKLWCMRAYLCANAGDAGGAQAAIERASAFEDPQWPPIVRVNRAQAESALYTMKGELDLYLAAERQAARLYAASGKTTSELVALSNVADAQLAMGDAAAALRTVQDVIERRRALHLPPTAASYHVLTAALIAQGELDAARRIAGEAVPLARASGALAELLDHLALMLALGGRGRDAARVAGRADASVQSAGFPRQPAEARSRERTQGLLRDSIPDADLAELLADGAAIDEERAAAIAVDESGSATREDAKTITAPGIHDLPL